MKNIILALLLIIATPAFSKGMLIDSAVNNVPVAYDATAGSKLLMCASSSELEVYNNTASIIAIGMPGGAGGLPVEDYSVVADGPGTTRIYKSKPGVNLFGNMTQLYIRSLSGSPITAGEVSLTCVN